MFAQRFVTRGAARFGAQLRSPAVQRRMNSTSENAWAKERRHHKEHAAGTTGEQRIHWPESWACLESWGQLLTEHRPLAEDYFLVGRLPTPQLPRVIYRHDCERGNAFVPGLRKLARL